MRFVKLSTLSLAVLIALSAAQRVIGSNVTPNRSGFSNGPYLSHLSKAWSSQDRKQFGRALPEADLAVRLAPDNAIAYGVRAKIRYQMGDFRGGVADCDMALKLDPKLTSLYSSRGFCKLMLKQYAEGIADITKAIDQNHLDLFEQDDFSDYRNRGNAYKLLGKQFEAMKDLAMAEKLKPLADAIALRERLQVKEAIPVIQKAIDAAPSRRSSRYIRGIMYANEGLYANAIKDFEQMIKEDPTNAMFYYQRADAYKHLGKFQNAVNDYNQIIKMNPNVVIMTFVAETGRCATADVGYDDLIVTIPDIYFLRGQCYIDLKDLTRARSDLDQALKMNDRDFVALLTRADLRGGLQDYAGAIKDCDAAAKISPMNTDVLEAKAKIFERQGALAKAIAIADQMIKMDPSGEGGFILRAKLNEKNGNVAKAIEDLNVAVKLNRHDEEILGLRATTYFNAGKYKEAIDDYSTALTLNPSTAPTFLPMRAKAYEKVGKNDLAAEDRKNAANYKSHPKVSVPKRDDMFF